MVSIFFCHDRNVHLPGAQDGIVFLDTLKAEGLFAKGRTGSLGHGIGSLVKAEVVGCETLCFLSKSKSKSKSVFVFNRFFRVKMSSSKIRNRVCCWCENQIRKSEKQTADFDFDFDLDLDLDAVDRE
jgi:hypothetical protein